MELAFELAEDAVQGDTKKVTPPPVENNPETEEDKDNKPVSVDTKTSSTEDVNQAQSEASGPRAPGPYAHLATDPIIKKLLSENAAFLNLPIPSEPIREVLPNWLDVNKKLNVWSIIKDMVGKDLYRLAVPVWLNEPLSMLQRLSEQLEYVDLLFKANSEEDSCLRMAYVIAFGLSQHQSMIGRIKKPFNPILGETFEYVDPENKFKFLSEQVSHHPPISAGYASSDVFEWWADSDLKTTFWGTSFEARPIRPVHVILKKNNDHFVYKRPTTVLQNLIVGTMYADNFGDMTFENLATKDTALLTLKKRGWGGRNAYEVEGWVKDATGQVALKLSGKWDSQLVAIDQRTKKEYLLWQRLPSPKNYEEQYSFSQFTKQLNYLYTDLVPKLPPTDCRLRPDQRAFEHGDVELAKTEKLRLEQKQRARRAQLKEANQEHKPRWFKQVVDPKTEEINYEYIGGYFECREKSEFPDSLDLYT